MDLTHSSPIHVFRRYAEKVEFREQVVTVGNDTGKSNEMSSLEDIPNVLSPHDENETLKVKVRCIFISCTNYTLRFSELIDIYMCLK